MVFRTYLTFHGECSEAIELYKRAFKTEVIQILKFKDMPANPNFPIPEEDKERVVQCTLAVGDDFIRLSDYPSNMPYKDAVSDRVGIAVEADKELITNAFNVLAEEGTIKLPLGETFYSPCAGGLYDKFGVTWNLVTPK